MGTFKMFHEKVAFWFETIISNLHNSQTCITFKVWLIGFLPLKCEHWQHKVQCLRETSFYLSSFFFAYFDGKF